MPAEVEELKKLISAVEKVEDSSRRLEKLTKVLLFATIALVVLTACAIYLAIFQFIASV